MAEIRRTPARKEAEVTEAHRQQAAASSLPDIINTSDDPSDIAHEVKDTPLKDTRLHTGWLLNLVSWYIAKMDLTIKGLLDTYYYATDVNKEKSAINTDHPADVNKLDPVTDTHLTVDISKPETLNQKHRFSLTFMDKGVRRRTVTVAQVDHFCRILQQDSMFVSAKEVIPELQLDQSHNFHDTNPLITRILRRTKAQRPPAPHQPTPAAKKTKPRFARATQVEDLNFPVKKPFDDDEAMLALKDATTGGCDDVEKALSTTMPVSPEPWIDEFASLEIPGNYGPAGRFGTTRKGDRMRYLLKNTLEARGEAWTPENSEQEKKNFQAEGKEGEEEPPM